MASMLNKNIYFKKNSLFFFFFKCLFSTHVIYSKVKSLPFKTRPVKII